MTEETGDNLRGAATGGAKPRGGRSKAPPAAVSRPDAPDFVFDDTLLQDAGTSSPQPPPLRHPPPASETEPPEKPATPGGRAPRDPQGRWVRPRAAAATPAAPDFLFDDRVFDGVPPPVGEERPPAPDIFAVRGDDWRAAAAPRRRGAYVRGLPRTAIWVPATVLLAGAVFYGVRYTDILERLQQLRLSGSRTETATGTATVPAPSQPALSRPSAPGAKSPGGSGTAKAKPKAPRVPGSRPLAPRTAPAGPGAATAAVEPLRVPRIPAKPPVAAPVPTPAQAPARPQAEVPAPAPAPAAVPVPKPVSTQTPAKTRDHEREEGWFALAQEYLQMGDPGKAEEVYRRILREGDQRGRAANALGELYFNQGDFRRSMELYRESERLYRSEAPATGQQ